MSILSSSSSWWSIHLIGWICTNCVIFLLSYFNYKLQLKHRYLYKMLSEGLCTSRAAAMIINFCLLLIWLPMCKYFLTELVSVWLPRLNTTTTTINKQQQFKIIGSLNNNNRSTRTTKAKDNSLSGEKQKNLNFHHDGGCLNKGFQDDDGGGGGGHLNNNLIANHLTMTTDKKLTNNPSATVTTCPQVSHYLQSVHVDCCRHNNNNDDNIRIEDENDDGDSQGGDTSGCGSGGGGSGSCFVISVVNYYLKLIIMPKANKFAEFLIKSFILCADYSRSIHITVARTILLASVVHIVAHVINVINFSQRYDVYLSDLNMAKYRGQNPIELLISVPGITGALMLVILILMSLSSTNLIRNSSYNLFHHLHKLFILFVVLLYLHPSSRILKEQSNVDRHNPDYCYEHYVGKIQHQFELRQIKISNHSLALTSQSGQEQKSHSYLSIMTSSNNATDSGNNINVQSENFSSTLEYMGAPMGDYFTTDNPRTTTTSIPTSTTTTASTSISTTIPSQSLSINRHNVATSLGTGSNGTNEQQVDKSKLCLDIRPFFVSQRSVSWYVLSIGLSCFLLDSLFRRLRRGKHPIELISTKLDNEGNLIELVLSNNHKRFNHWLPGQYVYLNCPSISKSEWHPFTISSMCQATMDHFTLHIKTNGDWTRKLRDQLQQSSCQKNLGNDKYSECIRNGFHDCQGDFQMQRWTSICHQPIVKQCPIKYEHFNKCNLIQQHQQIFRNNHHHFTSLPTLDHLDGHGQSQVKCTKIIMKRDNSTVANDFVSNVPPQVVLHNDDTNIDHHQQLHSDNKTLVILTERETDSNEDSPDSQNVMSKGNEIKKFMIHIDGPFHSPFERILCRQNVSICIANGVGWTAFSSLLQYIINDQQQRLNIKLEANNNSNYNNKAVFHTLAGSDDPKKLTTFMNRNHTNNNNLNLSNKLHLIVIVTTIEQLKPFYILVRQYYDAIAKMQQQCESIASSSKLTTDFHAHISMTIEENQGSILDPIQEISAYITRENLDCARVNDFMEEVAITKQSCATIPKSYPMNNCLEEKRQKSIIHVNDRFSLIFSKPRFENYFNYLIELYPNEKAGIFCCGSKEIKKDIKYLCRKINQSKVSTRFSYHEEDF